MKSSKSITIIDDSDNDDYSDVEIVEKFSRQSLKRKASSQQVLGHIQPPVNHTKQALAQENASRLRSAENTSSVVEDRSKRACYDIGASSRKTTLHPGCANLPIDLLDVDDDNGIASARSSWVSDNKGGFNVRAKSARLATMDEIEAVAAGLQVIDIDEYQRERRGPRPGDYIIDLEQEEGNLYRELLGEEQLFLHNHRDGRRYGSVIPESNTPTGTTECFLEEVVSAGLKVRPGKVVELKEGEMLLVRHIVAASTTFLRGHKLQRYRDFNGQLPKKLNELCFKIEIDLDDPRPHFDQSMSEVALDQVKRIRHVRFTNKPFPEESFRSAEDVSFNNMAEAENEGHLVVRCRYSIYFPTAQFRLSNNAVETIIEQFREQDLVGLRQTRYITDDATLRSRFRGETVLGGSHFQNGSRTNTRGRLVTTDGIQLFVDQDPVTLNGRIAANTEVISLDGDEVDLIVPRRRLLNPNNALDRRPWNAAASLSLPSLNTVSHGNRYKGVQKYTFGDGFCGAGGATRGALMAGLEIKYGFDFSASAGRTWQRNFPHATLYQMWADQFASIGSESDQLKVDVLHLSFPCQFFSPAHTVEGKDDDMNSATMFSCGPLLDAARPRIVTIEQTFGFASPKFRGFFNSLIHIFTGKGFSVRWKLCHLQHWGLPQRRLRLIMIAACPGEVLPELPRFTHGDEYAIRADPSLRPYNSVNRVLNNIPRNAANHDIKILTSANLHEIPWDGSSIAPRCITTHGGQNYHPSGRRKFTDREFAALQGFPHYHEFCAPGVVKQIGNAVPPTIAKILFEAVREALEKADGVQPGQPNVTMIED